MPGWAEFPRTATRESLGTISFKSSGRFSLNSGARVGNSVTLYRGENGSPHVIGFRCAHRGTQLSVGWVEGDCLRCFYHGWKYDGSGQCVEQPAESKPFAEKIQIQSYPVTEYLGLIFGYMVKAEPPPPRYPKLESPEISLDLVRLNRICNYLLILGCRTSTT